MVASISNGCLDAVKNMGSELSRSEIETPILFLITDGLIQHVDLNFCEPNPHVVFFVWVAHLLHTLADSGDPLSRRRAW